MKKLLFLSLLVAIFVVSRQEYLLGRSYNSRSDCRPCSKTALEQEQTEWDQTKLESLSTGSRECMCRKCKKRRRKWRRKTPAQTSPYGKVDYHSPAESVFGDQGTRGMASPSLSVSGMSESGTFGR